MRFAFHWLSNNHLPTVELKVAKLEEICRSAIDDEEQQNQWIESLKRTSPTYQTTTWSRIHIESYIELNAQVLFKNSL